MSWHEADRLNEQGRVLADEGRHEEAADRYRQALELCPEFEPAWFNLGLLHKFRREWPQAYECNRRAAELSEAYPGDPGEPGEPAWWNLGIAATAVRDWRTARRAWAKYGLPVPDVDSDAEWRADFGLTPVRINPDGDGEVVWCHRIDPCRAVVRNIPLPQSGRRWGEIVLHDGVPNGERAMGGRQYPVFDELDLWEPSDVPTWEVEVEVAADEDARALSETFFQAGYFAEDWSTSIRWLCQACSAGRPDAEHTHDALPARPERERLFGLAAPPGLAAELLERWSQDGGARPGATAPPPWWCERLLFVLGRR